MSRTIKLFLDKDNYFLVLVHAEMGRIISSHGKYASLIRERLPKKRFKHFQFKHSGKIYFFNRDEDGFKDTFLRHVSWEDKHKSRIEKRKKERAATKPVFYASFQTPHNDTINVSHAFNGVHKETIPVFSWKSFCKTHVKMGFKYENGILSRDNETFTKMV